MNEMHKDTDAQTAVPGTTGTETTETGTSPATDRFQQSRRDFLDLCGRMSISVPPAIVLLASSRQALASHGTHTDTPSFKDSEALFTDPDTWDSETYGPFRRWLRRIRLIIWGGY